MKNSMAPTPKKEEMPHENITKSMDYLKELRMKREQDEADGVAPKIINES